MKTGSWGEYFGPREIRIGRRLHYEELHSLYRSPNIVRMIIKSRRLRWAGHVARMEEGSRAFKILAGKPTGKKSLGSPRRRWEDNIRMDLKEIGINMSNWVDSTQDGDYWRAFVNATLNLRVPQAMELVIIKIWIPLFWTKRDEDGMWRKLHLGLDCMPLLK